ncbi:MAG: hypothetical protein AAGH38_01475 [Pseudomonadota bacterium]
MSSHFRVLAVISAVCFATTASVSACPFHGATGSGVMQPRVHSYYSSYYSRTPEQKAAATRRAMLEYNKEKMKLARQRFMERLKARSASGDADAAKQAVSGVVASAEPQPNSTTDKTVGTPEE